MWKKSYKEMFQIFKLRLQLGLLHLLYQVVLGLARTGLIFTRIQEGAQLDGLTQPPPGQTEQGIPYHVPSCWDLVGGSGLPGTLSWLRSRGAGPVWDRTALWVVRFVLCFLLICIVVVSVPFVCCSVKLHLSRPTSFCLFLSILLRTPAGVCQPRGAFVAGRSQTRTDGTSCASVCARCPLSCPWAPLKRVWPHPPDIHP